MEEREIERLKEYISTGYVDKDSCEKHRKDYDEQLAKGNTNFALLNMQMKLILAGIGTILVMLVPIFLDLLKS